MNLIHSFKDLWYSDTHIIRQCQRTAQKSFPVPTIVHTGGVGFIAPRLVLVVAFGEIETSPRGPFVPDYALESSTVTALRGFSIRDVDEPHSYFQRLLTL